MQLEYRTISETSDLIRSIKGISQHIKMTYRSPIRDHLMDIAKVSAVIITYNEEAVISETLSRLWWCNEIVVIDSGSTDKTLEICRQYGCNIFHRPFDGFGAQKNFGVSKACNNWILCIDADEILTDRLINEITEELSREPLSNAAYSVPRNLIFMRRAFRFGKENHSRVIRLFDRTRSRWDLSLVHERVLVNGPVRKLSGTILHLSYRDYNQFLSKVNLYSTLAAIKLQSTNARKSSFIFTLAIPFNFFKYYILDRNFLNGYRGFAWAFLNTVYHFVKYLKLKELRKRRKDE